MSDRTNYRVRVLVFPRPEILDPQGKAIASALERLGFDGLEKVRAGKSFELEIAVNGDAGAEGPEAAVTRQVEAMCERLLANPIVEDYRIDSIEALAESRS